MSELPQQLWPAVSSIVSSRLRVFAARFCPGLEDEELEKAVDELSRIDKDDTACLSVDTNIKTEDNNDTPKPASSSPRESGLKLAIKHDCIAMGCKDMECTLCQFNPARACCRNFGKKYLVGDVLEASCGAPLKIEVQNADDSTHEGELKGILLEVCLLDGVAYREKGGDSTVLSYEELRSCIRFTNHRDEALLQPKTRMSGHDRKIMIKPRKGVVVIPELQITESSEALLTGRRPPFRLLVMAVKEGCTKSDMQPDPSITYTTSEEFLVATRRVKQANKAEIPLMDDHISKIEHIGRETVKKLSDLRNSAIEYGYPMELPPSLHSISTVAQFVELLEMAEKDALLKKVVQIAVKLSNEKWAEASAHALTAVKPDFRRRIWYPDETMSHGVLFSCKYGAVLLKDQVCLVQGDGHGSPTKVIPEADLNPSAMVMMKQMKARAVAAWWEPSHPGWCIFKESSTIADVPTTNTDVITVNRTTTSPELLGPQRQGLSPEILSLLNCYGRAHSGASGIEAEGTTAAEIAAILGQMTDNGGASRSNPTIIAAVTTPPPGSSIPVMMTMGSPITVLQQGGGGGGSASASGQQALAPKTGRAMSGNLSESPLRQQLELLGMHKPSTGGGVGRTRLSRSPFGAGTDQVSPEGDNARNSSGCGSALDVKEAGDGGVGGAIDTATAAATVAHALQNRPPKRRHTPVNAAEEAGPQQPSQRLKSPMLVRGGSANTTDSALESASQFISAFMPYTFLNSDSRQPSLETMSRALESRQGSLELPLFTRGCQQALNYPTGQSSEYGAILLSEARRSSLSTSGHYSNAAGLLSGVTTSSSPFASMTTMPPSLQFELLPGPQPNAGPGAPAGAAAPPAPSPPGAATTGPLGIGLPSLGKMSFGDWAPVYYLRKEQ